MTHRNVIIVLLTVFLVQRTIDVVGDEMEDFPLDVTAADDLKTKESLKHGNDSGQTVATNEEGTTNNERMDLVGLTSASNRVSLFNKIMLVAMKQPGTKQRIAQVLPIIRAMSPSQRLTLATLVLNQLMGKTTQLNAIEAANSPSEGNEKATLMIPISADIASIFHGLGKDGESGRSSGFGTYYYNPLSAGYRVSGPQPQRPPLYNIRRFQFPNNRKKDDVPPEMMPPPYSSSSNVSYANFVKKPSVSTHSDGDEGGETAVSGPDDNEDDFSEDDDNEDETDVNETSSRSRECVPFINNLCLDVHAYPNKDIVNSIKNLEQKHVFRALLDDSASNVTSDNPEIERRYSGDDTSTNLQICPSKVKYARPRKAKSLSGAWKYIVNTEHYTQTVRIETCQNVEKSCSYLNDNVKSRCSQMYNYHRLLTWDEKTGLSLDLFKIPTCCSCQIQQVSALLNTKKYAHKPDIGLQENVIVDEPTAFHPSITKPLKPKTKPSIIFNPKRGESFNRPRRPPILPLYQQVNDYQQPPIRYGSLNDNTIRRTTSVKTNSYKGVYIPGKGTFVEPPEVESTTSSHRVNYNYHPIIDFFRSTPPEPIERSDGIEEWQPMTEGPRAMPK